MGKTALAVVGIHNQKVADRYPTRHFIPCDSVHTKDSLVATIASHLGLETSQATAKHVVHYLATSSPCLLILDNFETPWEPVDGRTKIEEFLLLVTGVTHIGLLV
jgi:hypothetical protein